MFILICCGAHCDCGALLLSCIAVHITIVVGALFIVILSCIAGHVVFVARYLFSYCGSRVNCGGRVIYCHIVMHSGTRCLCGALFIFILRVTCELWRPRYLYICIVKCRIVGLSGRFVVVSTPLLLGIVK